MAISIAIHCNVNVAWQARLAPIIQTGLKVHGIKAEISISRTRHRSEDIAIILGPNFWKVIEKDNKPFIMMNRKFLGFNKRDVHDNVAISWDGFNGRGTFCVDEVDPKRFERYIKPKDFEEWKEPGTDYLLFSQTDTGRCTKYKSTSVWYEEVRKKVRPLRIRRKENPEYGSMDEFRFLFKKELENVKAGVVLNSTVSTEVLLHGVPVISMDEGDPCWAINSHSFGEIIYPDRRPFFEYLAHCQWHYDEIESGKWWEQLYPKRGKMLCEWKVQ